MQLCLLRRRCTLSALLLVTLKMQRMWAAAAELAHSSLAAAQTQQLPAGKQLLSSQLLAWQQRLSHLMAR